MSELNATEENTQSTINNEMGALADENTTLKERVEWALKKPDDVVKKEGITKKQQKLNLRNDEKKWGNAMI